MHTVSATDDLEQLYLEPTVSLQIDSCALCSLAHEQQGKCNDIALSSAAKDYLSTPADLTQQGDVLAVSVKALPSVPAAIFMVLCGFLCVLFVRDRRVWLAALAALLWAGQTGINAIPQIVLRLADRNDSRSQPAQLSSPHYLENSTRLRSDIEGTRYVGLLRHLAGIPVSNFKYNKPQKLPVAWPQDAIIPSQMPNLLLRCLVKRTEQLIYFSPAFIFDNLARGPPR
jgi:hypothetical protein